MLLLDTHVLLWFQLRPESVGRQMRRIIAQSWANRNAAVSAITFWEIALLHKKRRVDLLQSIDDLNRWRQDLRDAGLVEIPIDGAIGILSVNLPYPGSDPADRLIIATAIAGGHQLVTDDRPILTWPGPLNCRRAAD